jgi:hypothetical protein
MKNLGYLHGQPQPVAVDDIEQIAQRFHRQAKGRSIASKATLGPADEPSTAALTINPTKGRTIADAYGDLQTYLHTTILHGYLTEAPKEMFAHLDVVTYRGPWQLERRDGPNLDIVSLDTAVTLCIQRDWTREGEMEHLKNVFGNDIEFVCSSHTYLGKELHTIPLLGVRRWYTSFDEETIHMLEQQVLRLDESHEMSSRYEPHIHIFHPIKISEQDVLCMHYRDHALMER